MSEIDSFASVQLYGYSDKNDYLEDCSSKQMNKIKVPFLALQPKDDPLHQVRNILSS
jgi:predicted alpha/beta-fold hydrolase